MKDCSWEGAKSGNRIVPIQGRTTKNSPPFSRSAPLGRQEGKWSVRTAETIMRRHPVLAEKWNYEFGLVLKAIEGVWGKTGEERFFEYIKKNVDRFVDPEGKIRTYRVDEFNLDQINAGKVLFSLYKKTGDERYKKAIRLLRGQLAEHPRTTEGGFWHKKIYPHQMWLDGIYMASPFYTEYAAFFAEPEIFADVVRQVLLVAAHTGDPKTGLFYHGWDESREQRWADPVTGCSSQFWGRAVGWFAMALVDILDFLPAGYPEKDKVTDIFRQLAPALAAVQDRKTGLWYQVLDQGGREGNYLEASASSMFVYAIAKGVRKGYIDPLFLSAAEKAYKGIISNLITVGDDGFVNLHQICSVAGLGRYSNDRSYRDGSFGYYVSEPVVANDFKGIGAFILASLEMEES